LRQPEEQQAIGSLRGASFRSAFVFLFSAANKLLPMIFHYKQRIFLEVFAAEQTGQTVACIRL
jgi:hypothetical protein